MNKVLPLREDHIRALAQCLGECGTGDDITRVLTDRGLKESSNELTKWKRLYSAFMNTQRDDRCANQVLDFIQSFLTPASFIGRSDAFEDHRANINKILALSGLEYGADGQFRQRGVATTISEAESRVNTIKSKLKGRSIHPEVLRYCKTELLQENYFHAVFEATKGLAQSIRDKSGSQLDGAALIDQVFAIDRPVLALNTLQTDSEKSEHKGFAMLLKGCFAAVRNPLAHGPKIMWEGEEDAADYLTLISLLHRKLDSCVSTQSKDQ